LNSGLTKIFKYYIIFYKEENNSMWKNILSLIIICFIILSCKNKSNNIVIKESIKENILENNNDLITNEMSPQENVSPPDNPIIIMEDKKISSINTYDQTALIRAIRNVHVDDVKKIISTGLNLSFFYDDPNTEYYQDQYTPLFYAVRNYGYVDRIEDAFEILKILLEAGCDPNIGVYDEVWLPSHISSLWYVDGGITPVMMSMLPSGIKLLLNYGADINYQDKYGRTALMLQSFFNNNDCVEFLINNGAGINIKDNEGRTALFYAIWGVNIEAIKIIIKHGTDFNKIDSKGYTPLDIACIRYTTPETSKEMIKILTASGAKNKTVIDNNKIKFYRDSLMEYGWWPEDLHIGYADR